MAVEHNIIEIEQTKQREQKILLFRSAQPEVTAAENEAALQPSSSDWQSRVVHFSSSGQG